MALNPVSVPRYPNVPNAPGVPPLQRATQVINSVSLLVANVQNVLDMFSGPRWGIFNDAGEPLLIGDSVVNVDYKRESRISDYPIEKGQFANYNKVQTPYEARVAFAVGGKEEDRTEFLAICDKLITTLQIVTVVTPEVVYESANVIHYDYRRSSRSGVTMLTVEVWIQEIRQTASSAFTQTATENPTTPTEATGSAPATQQPASAAPTSTGTVQPTTPTTPQTTAGNFGGGPQ